MGEFRVQFSDPELHPYSGCYSVDRERIYEKRYNYNGQFDTSELPVAFGYCLEDRQWRLYKVEDSGDGEGGVGINPCEVDSKNQLVYSADTDDFDIWSSFDDF